MAGAKKGYITFLLMLQWAYILLLPLLISPSAPPRLAGAYAAERVYVEQVALKRALADSAKDTLLSLHAGRFDLSSLPAGVSSACQAGGQAFAGMAYPMQQECARAAVISQWSALLSQWSSQTDSDVLVSCSFAPSPLLASSSSTASATPISTPILWSECHNAIRLSPDGTFLALSPAIYVQVAHRPSGAYASGALGYEVLK